jgi:hypothetical protein
MTTLLLSLSILACTKDTGDSADRVTQRFVITVENVGTLYPIIASGSGSELSLNVPVGADLTLLATDGDQWLLSQATPFYAQGVPQAPANIPLLELQILDGEIQRRRSVDKVQVVMEEAPLVGLTAPEGWEIIALSAPHGAEPAPDATVPAPWLQALLDGDRSGGEAQIQALTGITHVAGAGFAGVALDGAKLVVLGEGDRGDGLEALAEDGNPLALLELELFTSSAVFADQEGGGYEPLLPGSITTFEIEASQGEQLFFASMLAQTNDLFLSSPPQGIPLFNGSTPVEGEIADALVLYDAGTEINQPPGLGPDQAPRQVAPNTGAPDETPELREVDDGYSYPAPDAVLSVRVAPLVLDDAE